MKITSMIAIFFITWWLCLFMVLPWGVRNAAESGEDVLTGQEPGAPVRPMLVRKVIYTTILASILFGMFYGNYSQGWIGIEDLPFLASPTS